jgi:hypothetical protein
MVGGPGVGQGQAVGLLLTYDADSELKEASSLEFNALEQQRLACCTPTCTIHRSTTAKSKRTNERNKKRLQKRSVIVGKVTGRDGQDVGNARYEGLGTGEGRRNTLMGGLCSVIYIPSRNAARNEGCEKWFTRYTQI